MSEPVRGVVVAHGAMAEGLVDAVRRIAGGGSEALIPLSNEGKGPSQLRDELSALGGEGPVIVFADMHTGSCGLAALASCRDESRRRVVICGVNLPILLDFVFHREMALEELVPRLLAKGRDGILQHTPGG